MKDISLFPMQLKLKSNIMYVIIMIAPSRIMVSQLGSSWDSWSLKNIDMHDDSKIDMVGLNINLFKSRGKHVTFNK